MSDLNKTVLSSETSGGALSRFGAFGNKIFLHPIFLSCIFAIACAITVFEWEVIGAVLFVLIISAALFMCEDILGAALPFLLLCVFVTRCYNSFDTFIKFAWVAIPAVASIIFHFVAYRKKIRIGTTLPGIIAVSVALLLGGVGFLPAEDYFRPITLYYTVFLGIAMVIAYILLKSQMCCERSYDVREKFVFMLYLMGLLASVVVLAHIVRDFKDIMELGTLKEFQAGNNLSTILMFAMPCPFYFAAKKRLKLLHLAAALLIPISIFLSGSRGGLIMGALEFVICLAVFAVVDKKLRWVYVSALAVIAIVFLFFGDKLYEAVSSNSLKEIFNKNEPRVAMLLRLWDTFKENPLFGHGMGYTGNTDIYNPVKGAMYWYHMMIPQIVGSMGIVGIIAYSYQFFLRCYTVVVGFIRLDNVLVSTLALSYIGVLLMSMLNPGLFCPLPYALIAVVIFALMDGDSCFGAFKKQI